uniref:LysR substrate-binding domain-containing protein n=1 Tax=Halomonas faecis TaxID=1562110 RepID=UPI001F09FE2D
QMAKPEGLRRGQFVHGVLPSIRGHQCDQWRSTAVDVVAGAFTLFDTAEASAGPLRIGLPEEYSGSELPDLLSRFQRSQPDVELFVQCASSERLEASLEDGTLDLGILVADQEHRRGELLGYDPTWWVMSETLDLDMPSSGPLPLVLFDQACWWRQWALDQLNVAGREWRIAYTSDSIAGVAAAIRVGLGIGVLGRSTLPTGVKRVPDRLGLPDLPGSHLMLRQVNADAPGADAMVRLIQRHFRIEE